MLSYIIFYFVLTAMIEEFDHSRPQKIQKLNVTTATTTANAENLDSICKHGSIKKDCQPCLKLLRRYIFIKK